jgi:acyl-CoA synthetase (AMP-forming)/AMP-acid ligase II
MKFIARCSSTAEASILTDGQYACTYQALPDIFARLREGFGERGIGLDACLALECENSLPGALLLLYVLEGGYDFVLLPKPAEGCRATPAAIPSFCRYRVTTVTASPGQMTEIDPSQFVHITPNPGYREGPGKNQDPRVYLQTSGTTGIPKLAVHTHHGLGGNALNCVERLQLGSADRIAIPVPLFHMFGLGAAFLPAVAVGASIDLQKGANLIGYLTRERSFEPTVAFMTPSFCKSLLKGRKSPRAYRLTVTAGDRLRGDTFDSYEAQYGPLVQLYGSTEMGAIAAASPDDPGEARAQTVGKPLAHVEVQARLGNGTTVEDSTAGREPSRTDDMGELWCRHAYGFHGYVDDSGVPVQLDQTDPDGWFRMNDLGRILRDGRIQVLGRSDHSVNRSGLLVLFAEVEKTMMTIADVETVVIVAHGESEYGTGMAAFCVPTSGVQIAASDIHAACLTLLPRRAIPDAIIVVKALSLLPNGKVDRQALIGMASECVQPTAGNTDGNLC